MTDLKHEAVPGGDKEAWVNLLFEMQSGHRSCRNMADIILAALLARDGEVARLKADLIEAADHLELLSRELPPILPTTAKTCFSVAQRFRAALSTDGGGE
jgi:hypothetical protein